MKAKFVLGSSGAGKTSYCLEEIARSIDSGCNKPLLLLVPNQFSLEMEKKLVKKTGGKGMDIAQVFSFERLSYRVFSLYGRPDRKTLDETGKAALLRKIIYEKRDALRYYGGSHGKEGFINQICRLFSEFYKYGLDFKRLDQLSGDCAGYNSQLSSKIGDLSLIFKEFSDYIENEYITLEQNLDLLAEALPTAYEFHGSKIWLDGFYRFTAQDYSVIKALCGICQELTVSLTMRGGLPLSEDYISPFDPFYETKTSASRIGDILASFGCRNIEVVRPAKARGYEYPPPLRRLESRYFDLSPKASESGDAIFITNAANAYDEINGACCQIAALVREKGYRYKEIALCACDLEGYEHILKNAFKRYDIPAFVDMNRPLYSKRLVELIRSVIDVGVTGWSAESAVRLLRTELLDIGPSETDIIENYILEYGIKSYKWKTEWKSGSKNAAYNLEMLNKLRLKLLAATEPFLSQFKNRRKPGFKKASAALFEFIEANKVRERLAAKEENKRETAQIWNIVVSIFDKLAEVLGDEQIDIKTYAQIIEGALQGATEGFIPQTSDAVILGDIKRTRLPEIKALFVLGLNDGVLPSPKGADGLLSDMDRLALLERGVELAPSGIRRTICEQFLIYCAITKPTERLYLSWPSAGFENEDLKKSIIIEKLETIFPRAESIDTGKRVYLYSKKEFLAAMAVKAGELKKGGGIDGMWADGLRWLYQSEYYPKILAGVFAQRRSARLSQSSVSRLMRKDIYSSITRIEKYIKCPFSYFAEYGLRAGERHIYGLSPIDMGNIYHQALDAISAKIAEIGLKWGDLGGGGTDSIIESSIDEACADLDVFESSAKNGYIISRIKRITKRAVWALDYQIKEGSFTPCEYETGFGTEDGLLPPIVIELDKGYRLVFSGRIDRVDIYDAQGVKYVKIIDYKSGSKSFDLREVYYGLQLQLMLYIDAYLKSGGDKLPAGVFYFRITDPIVSLPDGGNVTDSILDNLRPTGLVVNDSDIIEALHKGLAGQSNVIPVKLKMSGEPDAYSSVATMEQFYKLMKRTTEVIREAGNRLIAGDIEPRPVKGLGTSPCAYCAYHPVCGFDPSLGYKYRNLKKLKKSEIMELLEGNNEQTREKL